jgi:ATP-binding cassette subfamily C protein
LSGLKVAKGFNAEEKYIKEFDANLSNMRSDILKFVNITSNGSIVYQAMIGSLMCTFIYISYAIYNVEFSKIIILLIIFMRISPRMADLQSQFQSLLLNLSPFETIQNLKTLCDLHEETSQLQPASTVNLKDKLVFSNVSFAYEEAPVISNVSFEIPFGSVTGLSGQSGSGKSTIADLAMGLLIAGTGEIRLDEKVLDDSNRRAWRSRTAYVPQESHLLSTSLRENLTLAAPEASDEEIRVALRQARAISFVDALPRGLDTLVGDGGSNLSGGERQRIALARALLKKPDLLILDEVTSALDNENTRGIIDTIKSFKGQITILLITHNEAVLESASQVISIDNGIVVPRVSQ